MFQLCACHSDIPQYNSSETFRNVQLLLSHVCLCAVRFDGYEEKTYEAHIDEEVHLYGLLHQLAFLAGKIKDRRDMENLIDTARRYGEIADQMFDRWSIPGRYLVFGDKADLSRLKALGLCELDAFYVEGEDDEDQPHA